MGNMSLSRRRLLTGASATAALGALGSASVAQAKAPPLNTPAPAFYRFKLGSIEATVVSDGPLSIGDPKNTFRGPTAEEIGKMMSDHFLPTNNVVLDQNVLVINTGDKLALFETGMSSVKRTDAMGQLVGQPQKVRHRSQRHRRGHSHARAYRPCRRDHGRGRQPQLPQRADLYRPVRLRILDRRQAAGHAGGRFWARRQRKTCCPIATASCSTRTARTSSPACRRCSRPDIRSGTPAS